MISNLYLRLRELLATAARGREEGQGLVEYGMILILIAVVVIVVLTAIGRQVSNSFSNLSNGISAH